MALTFYGAKSPGHTPFELSKAWCQSHSFALVQLISLPQGSTISPSSTYLSLSMKRTLSHLFDLRLFPNPPTRGRSLRTCGLQRLPDRVSFVRACLDGALEDRQAA